VASTSIDAALLRVDAGAAGKFAAICPEKTTARCNLPSKYPLLRAASAHAEHSSGTRAPDEPVAFAGRTIALDGHSVTIGASQEWHARRKESAVERLVRDNMIERMTQAFTPDELTYRLRQQELVSDFGLFCLRTHDVFAVLHEATRACAEGLRSELCKVLEHCPAQNDFLIVAGVGWRPGVVGHARLGPDGESPAGYALQTGKPVISNELANEGRFRTPSLLIEHGIRSAANVLISGDETVFGVLEVDSTHRGEFNDADSSFLQAFANLLGVAIERQRLEQDLHRKEQSLQQALELERVLVLEVHHRVKNSLALVAGLLTMQHRASKNTEVHRALEAAEARIHAIAEAHDHLARHKDAGTVPLDAFVRDLCQRLGAANPLHHLVCDVVGIPVSADRAIALGLLINELVTNALKYAYPDASGEVRVSIRPSGNERYVLEVGDNGIGMPPETTASKKGLGTKVIASLARQLGGTVTWEHTQPGTRVTLEFPGERARSGTQPRE
jgi:two-component sensor histidine kinase